MDKIKVGLASYGMSGKVFHAPLLEAHSGFELCAVLERSRDEARKTYPEIKTVRTYADLLRQEVDLIVVNIPDHLHHDFVFKALESDKNVVVEKPFTLTVAEGEELTGLADKKGLMLSVFQNRRWDSDFLTVQKVIREGHLGRLVEYEAHFDRFRNFIQEGSWKENPDLGSGTLYNLGSHLIDQALVLFGLPKEVFGDIRKNRTGSKVDDYFAIWLYYEGYKAILKASYLVREPGPRYQLHGSHGSFQKWGMDPQEELLKDGKLPFPDWGLESEDDWGILNYLSNGSEHRQRLKSMPGNYLAYYDNIAAVMRKDANLEVPAGEGLNVIRIIEAVRESNETGKRSALS